MTLCVVFWYHALVGKLSLFPATVIDMLYYWFTISGHLLNICHALSFVMNNKLDSTLLMPTIYTCRLHWLYPLCFLCMPAGWIEKIDTIKKDVLVLLNR